MATWTAERLEALSVHDRAALYRNACRMGDTPAGAALKALIETVGLPYSEGGMPASDDPLVLRMREVIFSPEGRSAALEATRAGLPAMAGVDPLLQAELGVDYGSHNWGTVIAGSIVGELMQSLGYRNVKQMALPAHCVAKTAAFWA